MTNNIKNLIILVLLIGCGVLGFLVARPATPGALEEGTGTIAAQEAATLALAFLNNAMLKEEAKATLTEEAVEENGLYKFKIKIEEKATGLTDEFFSYVTKDGKVFLPQGFDMAEILTAQTPEDVETPTTPEEATSSIEGLPEFIGCLKEAGLVIYGANWCGWTQRLVTMLGGFEMVKPIYIECTEQAELCDEKGVKGYPTILIKDKPYQGERTFADLSATTGCQVPLGAEAVQEQGSSEEGGCQ